jgi:hypothetical protein
MPPNAPPGLGASAGELASFFARSGGLHKAGVIVPALLAIPLTLFLVGVYRTLAAADRRAGSCWASAYLYGAIMMSGGRLHEDARPAERVALRRRAVTRRRCRRRGSRRGWPGLCRRRCAAAASALAQRWSE